MPDFDELERMDMSRVKLMWTNYPNMGSGSRSLRLLGKTRESSIDFVSLLVLMRSGTWVPPGAAFP